MKMRIKNIKLKDYKRFHDLEIDLGDSPKRIVALVGPNGCGKSSVLDGIIYKFLWYGSSIGSGHRRDQQSYHALFGAQDFSVPNNILIEFDEGDFSEVIDERRKLNNLNTLVSFRSSFRYNDKLQVKEIRALDDLANNSYGASTASDLDQRIEESYRRLYGYYYEVLEENNLKPSEAKKRILNEINSSLGACLDLKIVDFGNISTNRGTLYFRKSDSEKKIDFNVLSSGEKEVVDLLLDLYLRKDIYSESIYIIDEPELHLSTAIQRSLLREIDKIVPDGSQIWIATHSIGFLRCLQEELREKSQVIYFKGTNKWASESYSLQPRGNSRKIWQEIFETALDDLTYLVSPRVIVYCEGKAEPRRDGEEQGLDAKVFNNIFNTKYPEVLFVSSGGNTELDQRSEIAIAILSKVFPEIEIWVLKDRDMNSGNKAGEEERRQYLANNSDRHRVLNRFEIENYLYDPEILERYCSDNNLIFDKDKFDAYFKNIIDENLKDKTGIIKKCCGITFSINPEKFKLNLSEYVTEETLIFKELEGVIFKRQ